MIGSHSSGQFIKMAGGDVLVDFGHNDPLPIWSKGFTTLKHAYRIKKSYILLSETLSVGYKMSQIHHVNSMSWLFVIGSLGETNKHP